MAAFPSPNLPQLFQASVLCTCLLAAAAAAAAVVSHNHAPLIVMSVLHHLFDDYQLPQFG